MVGKWGKTPPSKGAFSKGPKPAGTVESNHNKTTVRGASKFKQAPNSPKPSSPSRLPSG